MGYKDPEVQRIVQKEWRHRNPEKCREYSQRYRSNNLQKAKDHAKEVYRANSETILKRHQEYRDKFPGKNACFSETSRAKKLDVSVIDFTWDDWCEMTDYQGGLCFYCDKKRITYY